MGWLKKLTKPISKVLDKIVPNEIKPALPYLAAFAPYMMGPGIVGASGFQGALANPWLRAAMAGGLNLGSQLSQEGSEGEFSGISALLAGAQGFGTAAGAADTLRGFKPITTTLPGQASAPLTDRMLSGGLEGLAKGSEFLGKGVDMFSPGGVEPGLNLATLEAAALPVSQATGDLAFADAQRALRDYENQMAADESMSLIDDDGRRRAIRAAMEAAGHLEEVIVETLGVLGLKKGGIVGLKHGGISSVLPKGREADYRGGGVIPVGSRERADDVPARLSKNEFVMTADAVRAAGGGSINKGAKRMYNLMHNLEARV